jgi:NADPH2:quinone reductase
MRALRFREFGPPAVLKIEEVPVPRPGEGEALVRVRAAAINPSDVKNVSGSFPATTLPRTPGRDFAGIVAEGKLAGREVWSSAPGLGLTRDGTHAEYAVVPEACLAPLPEGLTMEQAAAIGVPYITAWLALREAELREGETLLIVGAAGAVGRAATQVANWKQARVLGAATSAAPIPGVAAVIDTKSEDLRERVLELTDGRGADVVLDAVGGTMFEPALKSLGVGGRQIAITSGRDRRVSFDLVAFYRNRSRLIGVDSMAVTAEEVGAIGAELNRGFESGALRPPAIHVTPFAGAVAAYENVAAGGGASKCVLTF